MNTKMSFEMNVLFVAPKLSSVCLTCAKIAFGVCGFFNSSTIRDIALVYIDNGFLPHGKLLRLVYVTYLKLYSLIVWLRS